jgi:hypothetical protein
MSRVIDVKAEEGGLPPPGGGDHMAMSRTFASRTFAIGALTAAAVAGFAGSASAQYYYPQPQQGFYYQQAPAYVPPRIARKQAQQEQRFIQKYGYQQPQYYPQQQYYQRQPRYQQPQQYYGQPRVRPYAGQGGYYYPPQATPNGGSSPGAW